MEEVLFENVADNNNSIIRQVISSQDGLYWPHVDSFTKVSCKHWRVFVFLFIKAIN